MLPERIDDEATLWPSAVRATFAAEVDAMESAQRLVPVCERAVEASCSMAVLTLSPDVNESKLALTHSSTHNVAPVSRKGR